MVGNFRTDKVVLYVCLYEGVVELLCNKKSKQYAQPHANVCVVWCVVCWCWVIYHILSPWIFNQDVDIIFRQTLKELWGML